VTFDELLAQVFELLQREKRLSYRALKVRFGLDDEHLEALKDEIIEVKQLAVDDKGRVLVWTGESAVPAPPAAVPAPVPLAAIPAYLAETIRTARGALEGERKQVTVLFAAARIDRLPPEPKHLLQTAAVIGHDAPLALLRALIELPVRHDRHRLRRHERQRYPMRRRLTAVLGRLLGGAGARGTPPGAAGEGAV
jgi:hypothetical protein